MNNLLGENIIFLISQPRSGSTLLQRIISAHPEIDTTSEPWIMLPALNDLLLMDHKSRYDVSLAKKARHNFISRLPKGDRDYTDALRHMTSHLYNQALSTSGKRYFLDKTPRYYFIIKELYHTYPLSKYVILVRNPLAVLISIINTWIKNEWFYIYRYKEDLLNAPKDILEGISELQKKCVIVNYEKLIMQPENEIKRVCKYIGVEYLEEMIEYGNHDISRWSFGDQVKIYQNTRPVKQNLELWQDSLKIPQIWRLVNDYFDYLSLDIVEELGYSYQELKEIIDHNRPNPYYHRLTLPLSWLLEKPKENRSHWESAFAMIHAKLFSTFLYKN
jgi:hypothetical protein